MRSLKISLESHGLTKVRDRLLKISEFSECHTQVVVRFCAGWINSYRAAKCGQRGFALTQLFQGLSQHAVSLRTLRIDLDYLPELAGCGLPILLFQELHALLEVQVRLFWQLLLSCRLPGGEEGCTKDQAAK